MTIFKIVFLPKYFLWDGDDDGNVDDNGDDDGEEEEEKGVVLLYIRWWN